MTTFADAIAASSTCEEQQFQLRRLLRTDDARAKPKDLLLVEKLLAAKTAADYRILLQRTDVADMFHRQAAYFR